MSHKKSSKIRRCRSGSNKLPATWELQLIIESYNNNRIINTNEEGKPKCDRYWVLEGMASWTTNPCGYNFPGVYSKIDNYIGRISSMINPTPAPSTTLKPITTEIATTWPATTSVPTTVETTPETTISVASPKPTTTVTTATTT